MNDWQSLLAYLGVFLPLVALAWSAVFYTLSHRREVSHQEFERLFRVMDHLGHQGGSIASKMAAAYELRKYPQYRDVIIRMCEQTQISGPSADMLKNEMMLTARYLQGKKNA